MIDASFAIRSWCVRQAGGQTGQTRFASLRRSNTGCASRTANAADSGFSVRLFIGFDLAFYRWNSRFEATDLDGHEGGLISVPHAVGNRARGSGKDTVGTPAGWHRPDL